jgi:hypothetical protein
MPLPDTVVLRFVSAISDVENHLVSLAEGHKRDFLGTLSDRYGPEEAARGWLDDEPYLRFLITTYAGQFYGTMTRAIKAMKNRPKKAKRRGKKTLGFAFAAGRGHFLVKAFDPRKPMDPQAEQRISVERQRLDQRFLRALDLYRQQAVGCETYIWRSQDDDRVHARHAGYDDQEFPYSRPPEDGHPGQAYGCRCTAEPVWPEELSKSKIPTPSQQAIENAHVTGFLLFLAGLAILSGVAETLVVGLAIREAYLLAAQQIAKYVARNGVSQANQQVIQQAATKFDRQAQNLLRQQRFKEAEARGLFKRPEGVPKDWVREVTRDQKGVQYTKPGTKRGTYVKISAGEPESSEPGQQYDNIRQQKSGTSYDLEGNEVPQKSEEAHIPAHLFKVHGEVTQ